jgi:hypothetical protein
MLSQQVGPNVQIKRVINPCIDVNEQKSFSVLQSALHTTQRTFSSTAYSTTSIYWNVPPPDINTGVDRRVLIQAQFQVTSSGGAFVPSLYDGPRFMPLSSIVNSAQMTINGGQFTIQLQEVLVPLSRCMSSIEQLAKQFSTCPSQLDQYADYSLSTTLGSARNVFAYYGENSFIPSRGSWPVTYTSGNTVATFTTTEPLLLSPCRFSDEATPAFFGVESMDLTLNLGNISKVWSHDNTNGNAISSSQLAVAIASPPQIMFTYYTLPNNISIPRSLTYDLNNVLRQTTSYGSISAGASVTGFPLNSVTLNYVPRRLVYFVAQNLSGQSQNTSDTFCRIDAATLTWGNSPAVLSDASPQQLYNISKQQGYNSSFVDWYANSGSILCLAPGVSFDLDLLGGEAPGVSKQTQIQMNLNFTSLYPASQSVTAYQLVQNEGTLVIQDGQALPTYGSLSIDDVKRSLMAPIVDFHKVYRPHHGGDFLGGLKSFFRDAGNAVVRGAKAAAPILAPVAKQLASAAINRYAPGVGNVVASLIPGAKLRRKHRKGKKVRKHKKRGRGVDGSESESSSDSESESGQDEKREGPDVENLLAD